MRRPQAAPATWLFTWCGLGLGLVLSLVLILNRIMHSYEPEVFLSTPGQMAEIEAQRQKNVRERLEVEQNAARNLETMPKRVSYAERASHIQGLLDRYAHTRVAPTMASTLSDLRRQIEATAFDPISPAPPSPPPSTPGAGEPLSPVLRPQFPQPEEQKNGRVDRNGLPPDPDGIGVEPGGEDGKTDL